MNKRIRDISLVHKNYGRKGARAPCEEGDFFGTTRALRFAGLVVTSLGVFGCDSPEPQSGTNTNWACKVDADCTALSSTARCEEGYCTTIPSEPDAAGNHPLPQRDASAADVFAPSRVNATPTDALFFDVEATDTGWVAVGRTEKAGEPYRPLLYTSSDARTWAPESLPISEGQLRLVAFGNGTLVTIGSSILTKPPGGTWQMPRKEENSSYTNVLFGSGTFFIATSLEGLVSNDGLTWSKTGGAVWTGFVNGEWVQFEPFDQGRGFRTSPIARAWTPTEEPAEIYGVSSLVLVGGQIFGFGEGTRLTRPDGINTVQLLGPSTSPFTELVASPIDWSPHGSIATDGNHVVVLTGLFPSPDRRIRTTTVPVGSAGWSGVELQTNWSLYDVVFAHGIFVAVGQEMTPPGGAQPLVVTSTDGTTWSKVDFAWDGGMQ